MRLRSIAILLTSACGLLAQNTYLAQWRNRQSKQPASVTFAISSPKKMYFAGEIIPLHLEFTASQPNSFTADSRLYDRVGRMNGVEEFIVDRPADAEDPLHGLPGAGGRMGGLSGGPVTLSEKPFSFERVLNEWVRFRKPGVWRVYVVSHRVRNTTASPSAPFLELVSNIWTVNVGPAPAAWMRQQIATARKILDAPQSPNSEGMEQRLNAVRILRFLNSPEAAKELARRLGPDQSADAYAMYQGILSSPYRDQLLPVLEERSIAPDQGVSARYLDTMARLGSKDFRARLIASLPSKEPEARAECMLALLDLNQRDGSSAAWLGETVRSLIRDFAQISPRLQSNLLGGRWELFKDQSMIPVLRGLYLHAPDPRVAAQIGDVAIRRLYDLAPAEARAIIIGELRGPERHLEWTTLAMLPDRNLPELNDALASRLEAGQYPDRLILRYATGDIVARVEQAYLRRNQEMDRQKLPHCSSPLIFYFLKYDPAFGERELRQNMSIPAAYPVCYGIGFQFQDLGDYAMSPALEHLAIEYLASPAVPVKKGAAEVLGAYGSAAGQTPLWDALTYFHSWWLGREQELQSSQENMQLERSLRIALAQADAWTLDEAGLNRLLALCSSDWCRQEVNEWLRGAKSPVEIRVWRGGDPLNISIAQYTVHSMQQLTRKLAQFPSATAFLVPPSPDDIGSHEKIEQAVRGAGFALTP